MKDKHIHSPQDSALMKEIQLQMSKEMDNNPIPFAVFLWFKFAFYFALSIGLYASIFIITNPYLFVFICILYGYATILFALNFAHDFSHNTIFKSKKANNLGFITIFTLLGAHAESWKQRHIQAHHHAPNVEDYDSDLKISKLIRVLPNSPYSWYHRFQHIYAPFAYTIYSLFWIFVKDVVLLFSKDDFVEKKDWRYHLLFWIQKSIYITYILLLPILFSKQSIFIVVMGFFLMHLCQSVFLLFTFFMTHHVEKTVYPTSNKAGQINTSWFMNQVESSNDMHPFSAVANFIFGGFNNHILHHLFPHIHHIYYPKLNKLLYKMLKDKGITPNQTSYFGGILSHLRLLKRLSLS